MGQPYFSFHQAERDLFFKLFSSFCKKMSNYLFVDTLLLRDVVHKSTTTNVNNEKTVYFQNNFFLMFTFSWNLLRNNIPVDDVTPV